MEKKYNVNYNCGCVHEFVEKKHSAGVFTHEPTGIKKPCSEH